MLTSNKTLIYDVPLVPHEIDKIQFIAIHHTESEGSSIQDIHKWHKERGWNGGGYNEVILEDGTLEMMRGLHIGAQVDKKNSISYGIALVGNFKNRLPYFLQLRTLIKRLEFLKEVFNKDIKVVNHYELSSTECPACDLAGTYIDIYYTKLAIILESLKAKKVINTIPYWQESIEKIEYQELFFYNTYIQMGGQKI